MGMKIVTFKKGDVNVPVDLSQFSCKDLFWVYLKKDLKLKDEDFATFVAQSWETYYAGLNWEETYEKFQKIRLKRKNLDQYKIVK